MKKTLLLALILGTSPLLAREVPVPNPAALPSALAAATAGDILILAKGTWANAEIKVSQGGTETSPLEIRAEIPGETLLTGTSFLEINAPYVVVDGLYFTQGAIEEKQFSVIHFKSHNGTVRNTAVIDYNPPNFEDESYWAYFSGDNNHLDRCYFKGKNNMHPLLGNAINESRTNKITGCYFKNIPYADGNGREVLRMWGPGKFDPNEKDGAYSLVAGNLFDKADGEGTEIISLKSNYNQVLSNTIISSRGCLNIRQGSHNLVQGNIILGKGYAGAQGYRMSGSFNRVEGNYVSGCDWGIRTQCGEFTDSALTSSYEPNLKEKKAKKGQESSEVNVAKYPPLKKLILANNISANNTGADLEIGFAYKRHWPENQLVLLPQDCIIKDNRFLRPQGGESVIGSLPDTIPPLDKIVLIPNQYENNLLLGGTCAYAPAESGCKKDSFPSDWNEEKELANFKQLTPEDVGPPWIIALRKAGQLAIEDDQACYRLSSAEGDKPKKKKKKKD